MSIRVFLEQISILISRVKKIAFTNVGSCDLLRVQIEPQG